MGQRLRSLRSSRNLLSARHLTTRADDSHAAPVLGWGLDTVGKVFPPAPSQSAVCSGTRQCMGTADCRLPLPAGEKPRIRFFAFTDACSNRIRLVESERGKNPDQITKASKNRG